jgi:undecaprenyl-diphosphatase
VFSFFASISSDGVISAMKFFTFFGSDSFLFPAYVVTIGYFVFQRKFRYGLHIAIIALSSTALMFAIKEITHRHRPDLPIIKGISNYSFPSGHALSIFIFCGIFVYIIWHSQLTVFIKWLLSILLFCFTVTVGISRIILKVHFPTDVVASFCLGILWAVSSLWVLRKISKKEEVAAT